MIGGGRLFNQGAESKEIALSPLATGCENPSMYVERKNLRFKPIAMAAIAGAVAQVAVSVGGAYLGFGAKSLALGFVGSAAASTRRAASLRRS